MANTLAPKIAVFSAGGTIVKGHAVKLSSKTVVVECTAATDFGIGIAQTSAASGDLVEVALPGGGAKAKAQTTIAIGKLVVSHTDGTLKPIATAGDRILGVAMDAAVVGDLFDVNVVMGTGYAANL